MAKAPTKTAKTAQAPVAKTPGKPTAQKTPKALAKSAPDIVEKPKAKTAEKPATTKKPAAKAAAVKAKKLQETPLTVAQLASEILADRIMPTIEQIKAIALSALGQPAKKVKKGKSKKK